MLLLVAGACDQRPDQPAFALEQAQGRNATVELRGLGGPSLRALRKLGDRPEAWTPIFWLAVGPGLPPVSGRYQIEGGRVRFTPDLPLQPGRSYLARFDPGGRAPLTARLTPRAEAGREPAQVVAVQPSGHVWPANLLRLYLQFSTPMAVGEPGGLALLDERGKPLDDPFLPLGYEFWSPDHTRLTVLLDPGRVKRGVIAEPILRVGGRYTLVVGPGWLDATGSPLAAGYRFAFQVGPPRRSGLDPKAWRVTPPPVGSRAPLDVVFDRPLDHGLLLSAVGVAGADGGRLAGRASVGADETGWSFTPEQAWKVEDYRLLVQPWLEDPAGNRPGAPFEQDGRPAPAASKPSTRPLELRFRPA
jgi:hypothetical protein